MTSNRAIYRNPTALLWLSARVLDALAVVICGVIAYAIRFSGAGFAYFGNYGMLIAVASLLTLTVFPVFGVYRSWRSGAFVFMAVRILAAWITVLVTLVVLMYVLRIGQDISRIWFGTWVLLTAATMLGVVRLTTYGVLRAMRRKGFNTKRVVIYGAGRLGLELLRKVRDADWTGFQVVALFDDDGSLGDDRFHGIDIFTQTTRLSSLVLEQDVDEVWVTLPLLAEKRIREIQNDLQHHSARIRLVLDMSSFLLLNHAVSDVMGTPTLDLTASPMQGGNRVVKAVEDYLLATIILVAIAPLMLLIALGIMATSRGPVFFVQKRHGQDGREISVYKFRTMVTDKPVGLAQATRDDQRVTPFGRILRCTSLDELPQFINVLQGRMSIVGPRPHPIHLNRYYKDRLERYMMRHKIKPGITGWAQVNGYRGETDTLEKMEKRLEFDLYYMEHWSLWFDLRILAMTLTRGFVHHNAY